MYAGAKRILDVVVAGCVLILASPFMLLIALSIRATMGSPVLFRQQRPGYREQPFYILKFTTMSQARNERGELLPDEERLTNLGRWLRRLSLDELPQLWNVLRGDLSLVGPRPLLMEYLERYTPEEARRHEVKPGITGWAQVHGRQNIPFSQRLAFDVWYVDHRSFWLDLKILFMTAWRVLTMSGSGSSEVDDVVDDVGLRANAPNARQPKPRPNAVVGARTHGQ